MRKEGDKNCLAIVQVTSIYVNQQRNVKLLVTNTSDATQSKLGLKARIVRTGKLMKYFNDSDLEDSGVSLRGPGRGQADAGCGVWEKQSDSQHSLVPPHDQGGQVRDAGKSQLRTLWSQHALGAGLDVIQ